VITWQEISTTTVELSGELTQRSVGSLLPVNTRLSAYDQELNLELSKLSLVDSAGLAFLIEVQEHATRLNIKLNFSGSTSGLDKLISLYNAQSLLEN